MFLSPLDRYLLSVVQDIRVLEEALVMVCTCISMKTDPVFDVVLFAAIGRSGQMEGAGCRRKFILNMSVLF